MTTRNDSAGMPRFAEKEIRPHIMEWDESQHFPKDLFHKMGELGLLGVYIPQEFVVRVSDTSSTSRR
jgi:alkylation response protein AidB-like acyl-CoA dehydrogenase